MKSVVVTGASSAVGVAFIEECVRQKTPVIAVVRPGSPNNARIEKHSLVSIAECDAAQIDRLPSILKETEVDGFFHFAWRATTKEGRHDVIAQEQNIRETLQCAQVAKALGCDVFVGAGSQAEYGRWDGRISSDTPVRPEYAYGVAKYAAGQLAKEYCIQQDMRFAWGRIFSAYGRFDADHTMISGCIDALLKGEKPSLTQGIQKWDYINYRDVARAFYLIGEKGDGEYCIASGTTRPLVDYICILRDSIDKKLPLGIGEVPYPEGQVMNLEADISKLKNDTGFEPMIGFEEGIADMIEWYRRFRLQ